MLQLQLGEAGKTLQSKTDNPESTKKWAEGGDILKILKFGIFVHKRIIQSLYICL